jgi:hypothetical protein
MGADIPARFDQMHVETTVRLKDGSTVNARCDGPRGKWGGTPISDEDHLTKIRDCLSVRLDDDKAERVIDMARRIDDLGSDEIGELMALVSG